MTWRRHARALTRQEPAHLRINPSGSNYALGAPMRRKHFGAARYGQCSGAAHAY